MRYYCPECREFLEESGTILDTEYVPSEYFGQVVALTPFSFRVCACCGEEVDDAPPEPEIEDDEEDGACCVDAERELGGNCINCGYPHREE